MKSSRFRLEPRVTGEGRASLERVPSGTQDGVQLHHLGKGQLSAPENKKVTQICKKVFV